MFMSEENTVTEPAPTTQQPEAKAPDAPPAMSPDQQENWRTLRDKYKAAQERAEALESFVMQNINKLQGEPQAAPATVDDSYDLPDDYLQGADVKKWAQTSFKKEVADTVRQEVSRMEQERLKRELPQRMKAEMPDYDQVCNADNVAWFEANHPDMADALSEIKDPYKLRKATYGYLKKVLPNTQAHVDKAKVENTTARPAALSSVGQNAVADGRAGVMDETKRRALYESMLRAAKGG